MFDFFIYLIHLVTAHPFGCMGGYVLSIFVFGLTLRKKGNKVIRWLFGLGFIYMFIDFFAGGYINATLIHRFGEKGAAKITGSYATSTRYNNHDVNGYHMLLKTQNGKTIETSFEDDDFNVYPRHNSVNYPSADDSFNVSSLRHFSSAFVIINNDNSPWAIDLRCRQLHRALYEAREKYNFEPNNLKYRDAYIKAKQNLIHNRCYTDSSN